DGRWLAYSSRDTGSSQIFVSPFGRSGSRFLVSTGELPVWSPSGLKLYFTSGTGRQIVSVNCADERETFRCDSPRPCPGQPIAMRGGAGSFDVAADGSILALLPTETPAASAHVHFLFHFGSMPTAAGQ